MKSSRIAALLMLAWLLPATVWAQAAGTIAGLVRDTSGAVLPGVTVEVASPALIEKVRTAVTDGEGQYKVVDLRPGVYTVTFTLAGFSTFRREAIELSAGFTATAVPNLRNGSRSVMSASENSLLIAVIFSCGIRNVDRSSRGTSSTCSFSSVSSACLVCSSMLAIPADPP